MIARNSLRDIALLERIAKFTADNTGNITSSKKIADFLKSQKLKGSVDTVQNYLSMLTSAFILHKINRFDIKGKRLLEIHEKYYAGDIGLKHCLLGYKMNILINKFLCVFVPPPALESILLPFSN